MLIDIVLLIVFLAVLSKSADFAVDQAENISDFLGVSKLAIGFLLISVLTSLPELSVSVFASLVGSGGIVFGNVFSSNVFNIFFTIGISALFYKAIKISKEEMDEIFVISAVTFAIILYILLNIFFGSGLFGFVEGAALLCLFCLYAFFASKRKNTDGTRAISKKSALLSFIFFIFAIVTVLVSAGLVVEYAIKVAADLHLSEAFISATLFAFGTTLPELSVILQAARRKSYGVALGTCIGSCLVNISMVLGSALVLRPINTLAMNHSQNALLFLVTMLVFNLLGGALLVYFAMVKKEISRLAGILLLLLFAAYLAIISYLQV